MSAALLYGLVIGSAIAHAVWNALVKSAGDRALTMVAFLAIGETLSTGQIVAVVLISLGIMALSFGAGASRHAVGFALATGIAVATYSFFAGLGVRTAGTVLGFQACLEIVTGLGMVGYAMVARRRDIAPFARRHGAIGLFAGAVSVI